MTASQSGQIKFRNASIILLTTKQILIRKDHRVVVCDFEINYTKFKKVKNHHHVQLCCGNSKVETKNSPLNQC